MLPYGKQDIVQTDINAVLDVLKSDFLTQGPKVPLFEKSVSDYCGAKYGIAVNSATSALHIACLALCLEKGDWLWTSPNSFVASANCGLYCKAKVDFIDIDAQTYNISVDKLEKKLIQAKKENKLPKVVIPVHFSGQSCDMRGIYKLSKKYGFKIIEDASHAIGGKYLDKPIGGCQYSDITIFSFHPVKIITTAEGGMATTNNVQLAEKMNLYRSHGITRDKRLMKKSLNESWYYQQIDLGFNYRMTELQAALGISQMKRLDGFIKKRHIAISAYNSLLRTAPVILPKQDSDCYSSGHLYVVRILNSAPFDRNKVFKRLRINNIGVNVHYIPIYRQPYYSKFGYNYHDFPETEKYYSEAITIPLFPTITWQHQCSIVKEFLG